MDRLPNWLIGMMWALIIMSIILAGYTLVGHS